MAEDGKGGPEGFGGGGGGESGGGLSAAQRLAGRMDESAPLVSDAERARQAEARVRELEQQLAEVEKQLKEAREMVDAVERRHQIDLALLESDALDLETARLLTEIAVDAMDEPDVQAAIAELRRGKPFLFRNGAPAAPGGAWPAPGAMGAAAGVNEGAGSLDSAAASALRTGNRSDLMRYLRERRAAV